MRWNSATRTLLSRKESGDRSTIASFEMGSISPAASPLANSSSSNLRESSVRTHAFAARLKRDSRSDEGQVVASSARR